MNISEAGKDLIKSFEGCYLKAYKNDGETYWTIGWGHYGPDVYEGEVITQEEADLLFDDDMTEYVADVNNYALKKFPGLNQNQFDALVSYTYNRGLGGLQQILANSSSINELGTNFPIYWGSNYYYKDALIARRKVEEAYYFNGDVPASINKQYLAAGREVLRRILLL